MYAQKLVAFANEKLNDAKKIVLKFSSASVTRFNKLHILHIRRIHEKALIADKRTIDFCMPNILRIVMTFTRKDVECR